MKDLMGFGGEVSGGFCIVVRDEILVVRVGDGGKMGVSGIVMQAGKLSVVRILGSSLCSLGGFVVCASMRRVW